jgi:hypothetical protein
MAQRRHFASTLCDEVLEDGFERDPAGAVLSSTALEIDPAFVEAFDHADAGEWMLHSLRAEQRLPRLARHRFHPHGMADRLGKARSDVVRRVAARPFELDDALARLAFAKQVGCRTSNIGRRDHRNRMVERLQERGNDPGPRRLYIPARIFHEPGGPQKGDGNRHGAQTLFRYPGIVQ